LGILSLRDVHAYYGKAHILQGVSLDVEEGTVVGLFGRNGAGKTTLIRTIMNLVPRSLGEIEFQGRSLTGMTTDQRARAGLVYMAQDTRVFPDLTVRENCQPDFSTVCFMNDILAQAGQMSPATPHLFVPTS
jgi:ABC-type branched-subunit amino acid transport system ATPase component